MKILTPLICLFALTAQAQTESVADFRGFNSAMNPSGRWIFGSVQGGALGDLPNEADVDIRQAGAKANLSWYAPTMINDLGLGYARFDNRNAGTVMDTAILEGMAGYRFRETWHAGPVLSTTLGKARDLGASDDTMAAFLGLGVYKDWAITRHTMARIGLKGLGDLNIPGQTVTSAMLEIQVGGSSDSTRIREEWGAFEEPEEDVDEVAFSPLSPGAIGVVDDAQNPTMNDVAFESPPTTMAVTELEIEPKIFFDVDASELPADAESRLQKIAEAFKDNPDVVGTIEVRGHADPTGSSEHNQDLSDRRAETVRELLTENGVDQRKVVARGYGEERPAREGSEVGYEKSRRVEIVLKDVKDREKAQEIISSLGE